MNKYFQKVSDSGQTEIVHNLPKVVCLCGSTRFYEQFQQANYELTMQGIIVLSVGFYSHSSEKAHGENVGCTDKQKIELDKLHLRKIDLADEVFIINVDGYVGESCMREIAYAIYMVRPIRWLEEPDNGTDGWMLKHAHELGSALASLHEEGLLSRNLYTGVSGLDFLDEPVEVLPAEYISEAEIENFDPACLQEDYPDDLVGDPGIRNEPWEDTPDLTTEEGVKSTLEGMLSKASEASGYLKRLAEQQRALQNFSMRVQEKLANMDDKVRYPYRKKVADLADDLIHLLDVSTTDLGNMGEIDQRRAIVLQLFLFFSDDDDDEEEEPELEPDGDMVEA